MSAETLLTARVALLQALKARNYHFITPTPATHARVLARRKGDTARDLRDVFGWSLPFARDLIGAELLDLMRKAEALDESGEVCASRVRASSLGDDLFLHSAYPTTQRDAVFFGPDSYRFADFIRAELPRFGPINRLADIGAGSGVGAVAALRAAEISRLILTDINPAALDLAKANVLNATMTLASRAGMGIEVTETSGLENIEAPLHVVIANPPYIADPLHRAYRDGGDMHGAALSLDWARQAAEKLAQGGALLLYTGSAIVNGEDRLKAALMETLGGFDVSYRELDPDVFGEELERADYADVERIAVVGVVAVKR